MGCLVPIGLWLFYRRGPVLRTPAAPWLGPLAAHLCREGGDSVGRGEKHTSAGVLPVAHSYLGPVVVDLPGATMLWCLSPLAPLRSVACAPRARLSRSL